ncbi:MAG: excinuclease ABC subunit UvrC [Terriglobales bacterium]
MDLIEKARALPTSAGVYQFKNAEGAVIYVGKAKDLRARVRTYFSGEAWENAKTGSLLREAVELETIVVDSEAEALALENTLIKRLQPRFNILLRDDKTYPYIRLTHEAYPRVYVTRRVVEDGSEYFGPFFPAGLAYKLVHFVHKHFLVPSCRVDLTRFHPRPCLQFHIHRCLGPCVEGLTTAERYQQAAAHVRLFLSGRRGDLARELKQLRDQAAAEERFEAAGGYRDLLSVLEEMSERQKLHEVNGDNADVVGFYREGARAALNIFHVRAGRMVERRELFWEDLPEIGDPLGAALKQLYLGQPAPPPRILAPAEFDDRELLSEALRVEIATPQRGAKKALLELAAKNAHNSFARRFRQAPPPNIAAALGLEQSSAIGRIDCFDISHFQGAETVASMVAWENGAMKKADYRKFKIRTVDGVDDFRSMEEAVSRRYRRAPLPDLLLIDGGVGQLHAAERGLAAAGHAVGGDNRPPVLASLAKREELIYVLGREAAPLRLSHHDPALHILQQVRDETHRFAVTFHRQRRSREALNSALLEAPGIGPVTARKLLRHFGSLEAVRAAEAGELAQLLPAGRAQALHAHLRGTSNKR